MYGALELGLIYAAMALGVYLTFKVLNFPDLTVDGSFTTGGATAASLIIAGVNPFLATLAAIGAGLVAGVRDIGVLLPSADTLRYGTVPLVGATLAAILVALGVTAVRLLVGVVGGDVLDLRGMDANLLVAGNQDFVFSTSRAAGTVALSESGGNTVLSGHVNNDGVADFTIVIADGSISAYDYSANEFLL